jgi:hypothetical protein
MAGWRDKASELCQSDLDGLLNVVLPFAQQQLAARGAFFPFGAVVADDGSTRMVSAYDGREVPPAEQLIQMLIGGVKSQRTSLRAVAIIVDVSLPDEPHDAIRVELEHREGVSFAVLLPYRRPVSGGAIEYQALRAVAMPPRVWA